MKRNSIRLSLLFLSVALAVLCQPSFFCEDGFSFCAWLSFVPLFLFVETLSPKASFAWGAAYGFSLYAALCFYLSSFGLVALLFVCALFGFYHALLFFVLSASKKHFPLKYERFFGVFRVFVLISFDFLRTQGIFGFSYGIVGYSQWKNPVFLNFASVFGVNGVSFLIYLVNSLLADFFISRISRKQISRKQTAAFFQKSDFFKILPVVLIFSAVFCFSLLSSQNADSESLSVALIQNASSASSRSISDFENDSALLKNLTDNALQEQPETELVVWAETAIVPDILFHSAHASDSRRHALSVDLLAYFEQKNAAFLIGNNYADKNGTHNSALYVPTDSETVEVYSKNHLVPFTEFWPSFLDFKMFDGIKKSLNCDFFAHGRELHLFEIKNCTFATPICFEDSFAPLMRKMKRGGADFFVNISDDAWSHSAAAQHMHLSMSVFRCAEFRTPMIRSTIDGVTCIISENGKIVKKMASGIDGFLCGTVEIPRNSRSLYLFWGDIPILLVLIFTIFVLLILFARFVTVSFYGRR